VEGWVGGAFISEERRDEMGVGSEKLWVQSR
jgi:hypothetical protein